MYARSLFVFLTLFLLPCLVFAQDDMTEELRFRDVAEGLRCPTCTGLSVLESEAQFSVQIKNEVRAQLDNGKNKKQILDFFEERYGPWILREPPSDGINALAWVVPILILLVGPIAIWFFVWKNKQTIPSYGVRTSDEIIEEMRVAVEATRRKIN